MSLDDHLSMAVESPDPVVSVGDLMWQGWLGDARDVPLMSHLAQPNALALLENSPRAALPLITWLGWEAVWRSADREMTLPRSGRRVADRSLSCLRGSIFPWSCQCSGEVPVCVPGGQKALEPRARFPSSAGLFFPGNVNDGVKNERCGWNLLWHRVLPGNSPLLAGTGVQSEASVSPDVFNFCAKSGVWTKGTACFSQGGAAILQIPLGFNLTTVLSPIS